MRNVNPLFRHLVRSRARGPRAARLALRALALLPLLLALPMVPASAATGGWSTPVGLWSPLDHAGRPVGLVAIYEQNGLYYGRIEPLSPADNRAARCTHCTGGRKDQLMDGLVLMRDLRYRDGKYVGGNILDPRTGRVYDCELRLIDGGRKLVMRGYVGIPLLGLSEVWQRMQGKPGVKVWPVPGA